MAQSAENDAPLADLIARREHETQQIARARGRAQEWTGHYYAMPEDREIADAIVTAGLTLCRYYAGEVDGSDYPADSHRHEPEPVVTLDGRAVGHICRTCLEPIRPERRGSDTWGRVIPPVVSEGGA